MAEELDRLASFINQSEFDALTFLVLLEECCDNVREKPRDVLIQYYQGLSDDVVSKLELTGGKEELVWGLPKVLLGEIRETCVSDVEFMDAIKKCLAKIAQLGDHDEILLFATELLQKCKVSEIDIYAEEEEEDNQLALRVFEEKVKLLLSLYIIPGLENIGNTSRFLATTVSSLMQLLVNNLNSQDYDVSDTLLEIVAFFYDNYSLSESNTGDQKADERYMIDKILVSFWTYAINLCLKNKQCFAEIHQLSQVQKLARLVEGIDTIDSRYVDKCKKIIDISEKKLKIDLVKQFHECIYETSNIYINLPRETDGKVTNELTEEVYQMSYINGLTMMETRQTKLMIDPTGALGLTSIYYISNDKLPPQISFGINDAILLYIRFASASLYSSSFHNTFIEGLCRFYLWNGIINSNDNTLLFKKTIELVPSYMLKIFLQLLLLKTCTESNNSQKRMNLSLISHILAFCNDSLAFDFILDTLLSCPYLEAKIAVAGLLKDLMSKNSTEFKLGSKETLSDENAPPPLPDRPPIPVDEHRIASIHTLVKMCIEDTNKPTNNKTQGNLILLQYFMNLLITLHKQWDTVLLKEINEDIEKQFNNRTNDEFPEIEFLRITNATLAQCLE